MKNKITEKIYKSKKDINRIWIEQKEQKNNTVFKVGAKYSYIVNTKNKTIKIVPYDEKLENKGTVSKKNNGEVSIIDIRNKKVQNLFKNYIECKITIFEDEIIIEGYKEKETLLNKIENLINLKKNKDTIIKIPKFQLDNLLNLQLKNRFNVYDDSFLYLNKDLINIKEEEDNSYFKQLNKDKETLNKTIKLLSLFSGIGAFEEALNNVGQNFELVNYCEYEDYISKAYSLLHNEPESKNLGDITQVDGKKIGDIDIATIGFPCQNISALGGKEGLFDKEGNKTKSGLFFDAMRILVNKLPKIAIIENVKRITHKPMEKDFNIMKKIINNIGYNFYYKVLNTRDFGIPHSRNRLFGVCVRKDIDNGKLEFPKKKILTTTASDYYDDINTIPDDCYVGPQQYEYFSEKRLKKRYSSLNSDVIVCMSTKQGQKSNPQNFIRDERGYRMLTAREMFALQGFKKEDATMLLDNGFKLNKIGFMCGNTISVCVLESVFKEVIKAFPNIFGTHGSILV